MLAHFTLVLSLLALAPADQVAEPDEKFLKDAGFDSNKAGLLDLFRKRTLTEAERKECLTQIKKLGSGVFEERKQAHKDLTDRGRLVIPLLRDALKADDAEIVRQAQACLETIESAKPGVPQAAARLLLQRAPDDAVPVLINYLPYTTSDLETEDILELLVATSLPADKLHPALAAALRE